MTDNETTRRAIVRGRDAALGELLVCNGIDATTGEYLLPAMDARQLARVATGARIDGHELTDLVNKTRWTRAEKYPTVEGVDSNDLGQAGWAAVFPAVEGPAARARQAEIREALAPLLTFRRGQATAAADLYREYAGELGYRPGETKQQYLARLGAGPGPVRPQKVPYYLLLVATPEEIPYRIQYQLDVQYAVGRIAFDTVDEYARYAQSVVDAETRRAARPRRAAFFGVANPNDAATRLSADHLVLPLVAHIEGRHAQHGFTVDHHLGGAATRAQLAELLRDPPALLFTASHGMGFPSGDAGQREGQGALLCQDWAGPGNPVGRDHYFAGEDVPEKADLRGMIGVLFACYGAGTPTRDEFTARTRGEGSVKQLAPAPLVARLPQRMLGHDAGGALAVVGHIDRAWGSTFLWIDAQGKGETRRHLDVFESLLDSVLAGKRLGYAMESFNLRYAELAADLSERIEQIERYDEHYDDRELAHLWICNNDARNYAVIGDPAVRIPDDRGEAAPPRKPVELRGDARGPGPGQGQPPGDARGEESGESRARTEPGEPPVYSEPAHSEPARDDPRAVLAQLGDKLGEMLRDALGDAAVLEVKTYTSEDLQPMATGQPLPSDARLRAYTRCTLDGTTEVCVPVTATGAIDEAVCKLHIEMVKLAQAHRCELLRTVVSMLSMHSVQSVEPRTDK